MTIYVGYIIADYATDVCMSTNKFAVKKELAEINKVTENTTYIKRYDVGNKLTDLDCE